MAYSAAPSQSAHRWQCEGIFVAPFRSCFAFVAPRCGQTSCRWESPRSPGGTIRKGHVQRVEKGNLRRQITFIARLFGVAA
jgi:hypothetical protein